MAPDVVIIGTCHKLQSGHRFHTPAQHTQFRAFVSETCRKYGALAIAEEMSPDLLKDFGVAETNAAQVAASQGLDHLLIDLTAKERAELGLDRFSLHTIAKDGQLSNAQAVALDSLVDGFRECIWLTRILKQNRWPTVLVCGAMHCASLRQMFCSVGKDVVIEAIDYEP